MTDLVLDASSLILLAKVELLDELGKDLDLWITSEVEKEATKKDTTDAKMVERRIEDDKIQVKEVNEKRIGTLTEDFNLDVGEASTIALYKETDADILATDDGKAIDACKVLDVKYTTSLNVLVRLVEKGRLDVERGVAKLKKLDEYGWYKTRLIEKAKSTMRGEENE